MYVCNNTAKYSLIDSVYVNTIYIKNNNILKIGDVRIILTYIQKTRT